MASAQASIVPADRFAQRLSPVVLVVVILAAVLAALLLPLNGAFRWWPLAAVGVGFVAWPMLTPQAGLKDRALQPLVVGLCALGILIVTRLDVRLGSRQTLSMLLGLLLVIAGQRWFLQYRRLRSVKYPWVFASLLLFVLLRMFGQEINGARLWFNFGSFNVQPVEVIKLFMVFFMAAYLAENGEAISTLTWGSLSANVRLLGPLLLGWGVSILSLVLQRDVGMAVLFLGIFVVMLYVASRRVDIVVLAALVLAAGTWFVAQHYPYMQTRIAVWLNPWNDPLSSGYQAEQALFSLAAGGLFGTGYHLGHPTFIPSAATDYVFAAIAEELGLLGGLTVLALYLALVVRGLRIAFLADDRFTALLATGFAATVGIQVIVIVGGVIGLLPLTGITLPLFSYGGSSLVANLLMLNLLWLFSGRSASPAPS